MKMGWLWDTSEGYLVTATPRLSDALAVAVARGMAEKSEGRINSVTELDIVCVEDDLPEYEAWLRAEGAEAGEGE